MKPYILWAPTMGGFIFEFYHLKKSQKAFIWSLVGTNKNTISESAIILMVTKIHTHSTHSNELTCTIPGTKYLIDFSKSQKWPQMVPSRDHLGGFLTFLNYSVNIWRPILSCTMFYYPNSSADNVADQKYLIYFSKIQMVPSRDHLALFCTFREI